MIVATYVYTLSAQAIVNEHIADIVARLNIHCPRTGAHACLTLKSTWEAGVRHLVEDFVTKQNIQQLEQRVFGGIP